MLEPDVVGSFRASLRGPLLLPGESAYEEARTLWNAMIDRRPALIARCLGAADVITAVKFARTRGLTLSVKGGGHNIAGLAACDGGVMLDMSLMRGVWVDPITRTAHAQPGCLLGDVDRETQVYGLAAVLGFVSATGIAGLTLGGGFGYLSRRFGWSSDNVLSMDVVTAEGRVVRASEKHNSDLFWGLRGGSGNFGVVTNLEYQLHPLGPELMAGAIAWSADHAHNVVEMYRAFTEQAPPDITCVLGLRMAPPAPWIKKEFHGRPIVAIFVCHTGEIKDGEKRVASIRAFSSPVGEIIQPRSYVSQQSLLDATAPKGRRYYWKSEYLPRLEPKLLAKLIEHAQRIVSPHSAILVFPVDGVLNGVPEDHSAVGNRDARFVLNVAASWENAADDHANIEWARAAWRDTRSFSTGGVYVNFLTEEENDERIRAAYGKNYDRLGALKRKWDPQNLFRINKNIAPATS